MINFRPSNFIEKDNKESKFFVIDSDSLLIFSNEQFIRPISNDELKWSGLDVNEKHFLGYLDEDPCYVISAKKTNCILENHEFLNLRALFGRVPDELFGAISRALQIINWSKSNKFCGQCGSPLKEEKKERAMICTKCDADPVYPRIAPCVITLIHKENEVLLAHNINFPENFYSTLAGFIEPGESVEEALKREVIEEVGVEVGNINYFGSQTWPFPSQLMLGYFAEYKSGEIIPDKVEIDQANWFDVNNLPNVPPSNVSISGKLIEAYKNRFN